MLYLNKPIAYLENQDFDNSGKLLIPTKLPVVILIQASWCGYCKQIKPIFQEFANKTEGKVFCTTIQIDGDRNNEKLLGERIPKMFPNIQGIPTFILYINGNLVQRELSGNIDLNSLYNFVK